MKLNVEIIKDHLTEDFLVTQHGQDANQLRLTRPLLVDDSATFLADHVYVTSCDLLSEQPQLQDGTVIICTGSDIPKAYFSSAIVLLVLNTSKDLHTVFNVIQQIFNRYDAWDRTLQKIIMKKGSLHELLEASQHIFRNPLFVLDKNLDITAHSLPNDTHADVHAAVQFRTDDSFIQSTLIEAASKKKTISIYETSTDKVMCSHLFKDGAYVGGMYMTSDFTKPFRPSDQYVLTYMKTYVESLLNHYHEILSVDHNVSKEIFTKVLDGSILYDTKLLQDIRNLHEEKYICLKFKLEDRSKVIPAKLICEQIEEMIPGTVALIYENVIVAFMHTKTSTDIPTIGGSIFIHFLQAMGYKAGLSNAFTDILQARYYFLQACAAIDIGYEINPDLEVYYFKDYVHEYVLTQITREIPTQLICEQGLLKLLEYDNTHNTSYYQELRTYINCNMNAVQAAKSLYMHRNTLLIHLEHILKLTGIQLDDPEERMYVQLSYKLLEREQMRDVKF